MAKTAGIRGELSQMVPYVYEHAVSPHLASRIEGNPVQMDVVKEAYQNICKQYDYVTMEGSGGILCPICFDEKEIWLEDIIKELQLSCLVIANAGLGTINDVVLTTEYMKHKGITVKGIIFDKFHSGNYMEEDNIRMVEYRTGIPVIACVQENAKELNIDIEALKILYS